MKRNILWSIFIFASLAAILSVGNHYNFFYVPDTLLLVVRWLVTGSLISYALMRRTLATWIMVSMVIGAEIGYDWPGFATNLHVLSEIFLRMIKVIIAPLLFGTLVTGIAQHADLRKVGRMGIKAFIYFELATTAALFIGLGAINISQAGVGLPMNHLSSEQKAAQQLPPPTPTAHDIILHVFPENIAKSVADNQVLQIVVFSIVFGVALALVREDKRKPMLVFTDSLAE